MAWHGDLRVLKMKMKMKMTVKMRMNENKNDEDEDEDEVKVVKDSTVQPAVSVVLPAGMRLPTANPTRILFPPPKGSSRATLVFKPFSPFSPF